MSRKQNRLAPLKKKLKALCASKASPSSSSPSSQSQSPSPISPAFTSPLTTWSSSPSSVTSNVSSPSPILTALPDLDFDHDFGHNRTRSSMEDMYFQDAPSRENLSTNPGECGKHLAQRFQCTAMNYTAEIDRRIWGETDMQDFAYDEDDVQHWCTYGCGDGERDMRQDTTRRAVLSS
ncbi:hypothetical protein EDD37DRAFT_20626 [Exophiala viscosa]|uniref:uncharacterized protein n=1 Tax=Exophiala viscosa TaxID=2486360 RepID=UPI00219440E7|nr:hypothetical protein EDD37DRAFT_20626 [Exophiala viscosa]